MKILSPNLYMEAYGVLFKMRSGMDCRADLQSLLAKRKEKQRITELFQPVIEMMDACADLTFNPENPLYVDAPSVNQEQAQVGLDFDLFQHYYDTGLGLPPSQCIYDAFCTDGGKKLVTVALYSLFDEECADPIAFVLNSKAEDSLKVALLKLLHDGEKWISEFCLLLEQTAERIAPIVEKYKHLYSYVDQMFSGEENEDILFRCTGVHLPQDTTLQPCLSLCNSGMIFAKEEDGKMKFTSYVGILLCAIDFFSEERFNAEQLCEHLKMLADPTKLAILEILKDGPTYQTDLAKRLCLTTATISHHMGQLFQNGFVISEAKNKKIYYTYQPQMLETTLKQLQEHLKSALV